jgi:error-prone DNA polymerase
VEQDMVRLSAMSRWEEMAGEYEVMGLSPADHAMALLRPSLMQAGRRGRLQTSAEVTQLPSGAPVCMAGVVTCRQRPSTAKGVVFVSLEDEYGLANVVVYPGLFDRQRALILNEPFLLVRGKAQRQGTVVHVVAQRFERPEVQTDRLIRVSHDFH